VLQLPIGVESDFAGVIDLVRMQSIIWETEDLGATFNYGEIPADLKAKADECARRASRATPRATPCRAAPCRPMPSMQVSPPHCPPPLPFPPLPFLSARARRYRSALVETAVEMDEEVMMAYLEGEEPDEATLKRLIRKGTLEGAFVPVLLGTAFKNKGVQPLLDAVVDYMPAPTDVANIQGVDPDDSEKKMERKSSDTEPFSALAFKIMADPFVGTLTFARIYSGVLQKGSSVLNSVKGKKERKSRTRSRARAHATRAHRTRLCLRAHERSCLRAHLWKCAH